MPGREARACLELIQAGLGTGPSGNPELGVRQGGLENLDWTLMLLTARQHRLGGLLCEGIRRLSLGSRVPTAVWDSLQMGYYSNLAHNLVLFRHGEEIIERTARAGLPVLLLKGAALAGSLYGDVALRPMADLDLLVRREEARAVLELARGLGYESHDTADHATLLCHRGSGTYLEVHTSLTSCPDYFGIQTDDLLARARPAALWPEPALTLSPADHLLHLALHGSFQHAFRQAAINACDMFLLSRRPELDWSTFFAASWAPRLAPLVYGGLELAHRLLPTENLARALESLRPRASWLQRRSVERLSPLALLAPFQEDAPAPAWRRILWAPGLADALSLIHHTLGPSDGEKSAWARVQRAFTLVSRHGPARAWGSFQARARRKARLRSSPRSTKRPAPSPSSPPRRERLVSQGAQTDV